MEEPKYKQKYAVQRTITEIKYIYEDDPELLKHCEEVNLTSRLCGDDDVIEFAKNQEWTEDDFDEESFEMYDVIYERI